MRTLGSFGLQLTGVAAALLWHISITNGLGAGGSGVLFLAVSLATTLGVLTRLGGDTYLVSRVAQSVALGARGDAVRTYRRGLQLSLFAALAVGVVLLPMSGVVGRMLEDESPDLLIWSAVGLLLAGNLFTLTSSTLRGLGAAEWSVVTMSVLPHLGAVAVYFMLGAKTVVTASVALITGWMAAGAVGLLLVYRHFGRSVSGAVGTRAYLCGAFGLYQVAVAQMIINLSAPLFVGVVTSPREVALYTTAMRVTQLVSLVQLAVNTISGPRIVSYLAVGDRPAAVRELARSVWIGSGVGLTFLVAVIVLQQPILRLFGAEFLAAGKFVVILAAGQFLNVSAGCLGYALLLTSHERLVQRNVYIFGFLFVFGATLGAWLFGAIGIAIAAAASLGTQNLVLFMMARRVVPWLQPRCGI